jgi:hypothetical protein
MSIIRRTALAALAALCVLPVIGSPANDAVRAYRWKPAPAPLLTRWAKDVRPGNVRPEYPRPMAQRKEWMSLTGLWDFDFDDLNHGAQEGWQKAPPADPAYSRAVYVRIRALRHRQRRGGA